MRHASVIVGIGVVPDNKVASLTWRRGLRAGEDIGQVGASDLPCIAEGDERGKVGYVGDELRVRKLGAKAQ